MDHHHHQKYVSDRGIAGRQASSWLLQLLLLITIILPMSECAQSDIDCLRSIKESLIDPSNRLSTWQFDNLGESDHVICSFTGVECWGNQSRILNIRLSDMGLGGEFPQGLSNCLSLTGLDLSNNSLSGSIPADVSIPFATSLDLSSNKFSGEIPVGIAKFPYLNVLDLSNNFLRGKIPAEMAELRRLKSFSVANNLLSGPVPSFPGSPFPPESYAKNSGLCGYPLDPCEKILWARTIGGGFLVGWAVFSVISFVVGLFVPLEKLVIKFMRRTPRLHQPPSSDGTDHTMISMLEKFATRMDFHEINKATDNFDEKNIVSVDETGTTYKAMLSNGMCLAIKRLSTFPDRNREFLSEILMLGRLTHKNLVPLVGFCLDERNIRFLIYKFMPNGSLHDCLFPSEPVAKVLEWPVRAKIAMGIAEGIAWLHENRVVHRGISSKCILLDKNFDPKISDSGKATNVNRSNLYSWKYPLNKQLSVLGSYEEDIYGFGMVLLELITGKRQDELVNSLDIDGNATEQISHMLTDPCVQSMVEQGFGDEISHCLRVAGRCVECDPGNWPSMMEVYQMLIGTRRHEPGEE